MYQRRSYRNLFRNELVMFDVCVEQTDLHIGSDIDLTNKALAAVRKARSILYRHISEYPIFETSLEPLECSASNHYLVNKMIKAGIEAGTGPMAAVAGMISQYVGESLLEHSKQVFVENGGDIYIASDRDRQIGIYAGKSPLSNKLAIRIRAGQFPLGICTSSGSVGHSFSFGKADAVTVISADTALSDAVATAACNKIKESSHIADALDFAMQIDGVLGVLAIMGDKFGAAGDIELAKVSNQV